jgi:hypothetical protein
MREAPLKKKKKGKKIAKKFGGNGKSSYLCSR